MLIQVVDANDVTQQIVAQSPGTPTDRSGTIVTSGLSQMLLEIMPAGTQRSGWLVQNNGINSMQINDLGSPADQSPSAIFLAPGSTFPPPGYPVTQGEVQIVGFQGDNFMAREW